jgi:uncharacterized membrane protein YgcG
MVVSLSRVFLGSAFALVALGSMNCSSAGNEDVGTGATSEAMSSTIHSSYGVTSFGGPGDYQSVACGGNSRTIDQWYVASSQRYGCHKHLKLTANGKCAVVATADAGPASWVEANAGVPILDSSPTVGNYFFGDGSLGWSDLKAHPGKYVVNAEITTLPVGPCDGTGSSSSSGGSSSSSSGGSSSSSSGGSSSGGSSSGGTACSTDGDCNPGNDGSGLICTGGTCVPGCHNSAQCPGSTTCQSGSCR